MSLHQKYSWLLNLGVLPRMIQTGISLLGTKEIVGKGSSRTILSWRDTLNLNGVPILGYSDDDIPWCGLFAAFLAYTRSGIASEVVSSPLWARSWVNYGVKSTSPSLGDILVFSRNGGGHVGFYIAEDKTAFHVLGGNQSNAVTITRIAKSRCIAVRSPKYKSRPSSAKPYWVAATGSLSKNEA
jgi:uncharacterized protein (TIGR02594 family)